MERILSGGPLLHSWLAWHSSIVKGKDESLILLITCVTLVGCFMAFPAVQSEQGHWLIREYVEEQ
jgi:hypothetical protein